MKQICFILDWYPTKTNNTCIFAKHLINAIADYGFECVVIAPRIKNIRTEKVPYKRIERSKNGHIITVYTPTYYHLSSRKCTMKISMNNHYRSVLKTIKKENLRPDALYGHFIYQCGLTSARVGKKLGIPAYCASGESNRLMEGNQPYSTGLLFCKWKEILGSLDGIISVSSFNKQLLLKNEFIDSSTPIGLFPNGFDTNKFFVIDKKIARKKLGVSIDKFIVAFTGRFIESKGVKELCDALNQFDDVYSLFIGSGKLTPFCKNILYCGSVPNDELVYYLNASDVFVLPTKSEGCCNAIIEAIACGLPVISSDLSFNDEILNEQNSIRIDVNDVNQLVNAIGTLKNNSELRNNLSKGAICFSKTLDITERASKILQFMGLK